MNSSGRNKKINIIILLLTIVMVIAFYPNKQLYFDEAHSVFCSKGISRYNLDEISTTNTITSAGLGRYNTLSNVFYSGAGVYGFALHYYSLLFNNTLNSYVTFSVICGILALISFYFLSSLVLKDSIYTSVALILFITDLMVLNTMYSIRPYMLCVFFIIMGGINFFKYSFEEKSPKNIFFLALFSVLAILSHYFTIYIILVYWLAIFYQEKFAFFSRKNTLALIIPIAIMGIYFSSLTGWTGVYGKYQQANKDLIPKTGVGIFDFLSLFFKSIAVNFKLTYPLFRDNFVIKFGSFLMVILIYIFGLKMLSANEKDKQKYNLLFILGIVSSLFILFVALFTKNTVLFSYRYFLFSIPFCCLFITMFIKSIFENEKLHYVVKTGCLVLLVLPGLFQFVINRINYSGLPCNHLTIANDIIKNKAVKAAVPEMLDAIFINCFIPNNYNIAYSINPGSNDLIIYNSGNNIIEQMPVIKNALIEIY